MALNFDDYRQKGIKFYKRIARELQTPDLGYTDRLVTSLLNVLRERISLEESLEIISFLPMHVKGVYVHGWKLNDSPKRLSTEEEFLNAIRIKYPHTAGRKPGDDETLRQDLKAVFRIFHVEASSKGIADLRQKLPPALHGLCMPPGETELKKEKVQQEGEMQYRESVP
jgi:uncharacterized protein (DUF2267 family)